MRQSTSITGCVRLLVCWSVGLLVTHSFDDPHVAPYWPTWPCSTTFGYFQLKLSSIETLCSLKWCQHNVLSLGHVTLELCQSIGPLVCWSVGLLVHTCIEMLTVFCFSAPAHPSATGGRVNSLHLNFIKLDPGLKAYNLIVFKLIEMKFIG